MRSARVQAEVTAHAARIAEARTRRRDTHREMSAVLPALTAWANAKDSLREVDRNDVLNVLPASTTHCSEMVQGLRSIFQTLHARKLVFFNPTTRMRVGAPEPRIPESRDVPLLRSLLDDPDPVRAAFASLLVFHGLRPRQLRALHLTDLADGRLHIDGLSFLLAPHVRTALSACLAYRERRWPHSGNPHLFINRASAVRLTPVSGSWVNDVLGTPAQALREDRIPDEAQASQGDPRRIADLFGLIVNAAPRFTATVDHVSFTEHQRRTGPSNPP